ncbi:MAG: methyltransferase [Firmicutes bacterium]|nr:methyltransferase [Bacillota bacterium]
MERIDDIGFGGFRLIQDSEGFCYGVDAVLLADFAGLSRGCSVMDLGCGSGVIPLILEAKYSPSRIAGIELQPEAAALAARNMALNGLSEKAEIACCDVLDVRERFGPESFDAVVCNPPYFEKGRGPENPSPRLLAARSETTASFSDFAAAAAYLLKPRGSFSIIHRPSRLPDLLEAGRAHGLEPKFMRMVAPKPDQAPNMVLISFVKGAGRELKLLPQLCVRDADGSYTRELNCIYGKDKQ